MLPSQVGFRDKCVASPPTGRRRSLPTQYRRSISSRLANLGTVHVIYVLYKHPELAARSFSKHHEALSTGHAARSGVCNHIDTGVVSGASMTTSSRSSSSKEETRSEKTGWTWQANPVGVVAVLSDLMAPFACMKPQPDRSGMVMRLIGALRASILWARMQLSWRIRRRWWGLSLGPPLVSRQSAALRRRALTHAMAADAGPSSHRWCANVKADSSRQPHHSRC
jgi:hypothetical protein